MRSINTDTPVKCSKEFTIDAGSEKVWAILTDIDHWSNWQPDISKAKLSGELKPGTSFDWKNNGTRIHSTLHTVEPHKLVGWTGKSFGMFAIHNWSFHEKEGKTTLKVEESMEGFLARLLKGYFNKFLENDMQKWVDALKKACEK